MPSRRLFITAAAASAVLGAAGVVVGTTVADSDQRDLRAAQHPGAPTASVSPQPLVLAGNRVLFQGDSITDAYRQRGARGPNVGMGRGYAGLVASGVLGAHRGQPAGRPVLIAIVLAAVGVGTAPLHQEGRLLGLGR